MSIIVKFIGLFLNDKFELLKLIYFMSDVCTYNFFENFKFLVQN